MPPATPQPFQPFRANPSASARENAVALVEWATEGVYRAVAVGEANLRYQKAIYEALHQGAGPSRRMVPSQAAADVGDIAQTILRNRKAIASWLKDFIR